MYDFILHSVRGCQRSDFQCKASVGEGLEAFSTILCHTHPMAYKLTGFNHLCYLTFSRAGNEEEILHGREFEYGFPRLC